MQAPVLSLSQMSPLQVQGQHKGSPGPLSHPGHSAQVLHISLQLVFVPSVLRALKPHIVSGVHMAGWSGIWLP